MKKASTNMEQRREIRRLAILREQISRKVIAARFGISVQTEYDIERGRIHAPEHATQMRYRRDLIAAAMKRISA